MGSRPSKGRRSSVPHTALLESDELAEPHTMGELLSLIHLDISPVQNKCIICLKVEYTKSALASMLI